MIVAWAEGREEQLLFNGYQVSVGEYEKVPEVDGGDGCAPV